MTATIALADRLLRPRSIALIGASSDEGKHAGLAQRYLRRHGFQGALYPINPRRSEILGERTYAHIGEVQRPIDHAMILLPTAGVEEALRACGDAGVACVTILSNGFGEAGDEGRMRQARLIETARGFGMRVLGPNSLGLVNPIDRIALSTSEVLSLPQLRPGRYAVISQSGGMMGALLSRGQARGLGFSMLVSTGNEADLGVGEIGELLVDDPHTEALLLFLESVREPGRLEAMVRRAYDAGKPVVAFSMGRSALGEQLAAAHTGALAGGAPAMNAFLRDIGVLQVDMLETLLDIPPLLAGRRPARGRRVSVLTSTGGGGGMVVDRLSQLDIEVIPPSDIVRARLHEKGIALGDSPLIDLTLAGTNADTYGAVLAELLKDPQQQAVVAVVGASAQFRPDRAVQPIAQALAGNNGAPLAVFLTPAAEASFDLLRESGVAAFRSPEACADAVRAYLDWRTPRSLAAHRLAPPPAEVMQVLSATTPGLLAPRQAAALVAGLGIAQPASIVLAPRLADWPDALPAGIDFPLVAKIVSEQLPHKTEVGGVALGITSWAQLRVMAGRMLGDVARLRPDAVVQGIEVQRMETGLAEVLVGYRLDERVGPTITVGAGGVLAELYRDAVTRLAPVDEDAARGMVEQVRGLAVIQGYRQLPRGDVDALAKAISALSRLALLDDAPTILEAEINPLIVRHEGRGVVAVDALVLRA